MMSFYDIAATLHELHAVWTHRYFDCLYNNLFSQTTQAKSKSRITGGFPSQRAGNVDSQSASDPNIIGVNQINHCAASHPYGLRSFPKFYTRFTVIVTSLKCIIYHYKKNVSYRLHTLFKPSINHTWHVSSKHALHGKGKKINAGRKPVCGQNTLFNSLWSDFIDVGQYGFRQ